ncbi:MAG TPA: gamma-glutamylcyclotransferase [Longimicrobiales bacterium]|nr:gamma-glutamylcyclotransferase [Longimicrobiales bacterium]
MSVHVFVYDDRLDSADAVQESVCAATVQGTLFDLEGVGAALLLSGQDRVAGEVRRVSPDALDTLDTSAGVQEGLYRRVGVQVGSTPCWTWVAGPALAPLLVPERRVRQGRREEAS